MYLSIKGTGALESQFSLIRAYMMRYKLTFTTASAIKSFMTNLNKGESTLNALRSRLHIRHELISEFNKQSQQLLFKKDFEFDSRFVYVVV